MPFFIDRKKGGGFRQVQTKEFSSISHHTFDLRKAWGLSPNSARYLLRKHSYRSCEVHLDEPTNKYLY